VAAAAMLVHRVAEVALTMRASGSTAQAADVTLGSFGREAPGGRLAQACSAGFLAENVTQPIAV
jgi:hypothetical protein